MRREAIEEPVQLIRQRQPTRRAASLDPLRIGPIRRRPRSLTDAARLDDVDGLLGELLEVGFESQGMGAKSPTSLSL